MKTLTYLLTTALLLATVSLVPGAAANHPCGRIVDADCTTNKECIDPYPDTCYWYTIDHCLVYVRVGDVCVPDPRYYMDTNIP